MRKQSWSDHVLYAWIKACEAEFGVPLPLRFIEYDPTTGLGELGYIVRDGEPPLIGSNSTHPSREFVLSYRYEEVEDADKH